ncbi:MAG: hypothetical protein JNK15_20445 [Planctomycetes bacterium]|nr:hypothetical protein [Planctomycetota bacterium]
MNPTDLLRNLLGTGPLGRADAPFRLLRVVGPDAGEFLHRLCSQDVHGLAVGTGAPACFLDAKGKLQATCLVLRAADAFWLEVAAEQADRLAALLERYHFTEKLAIERPALGPCHEQVGLAADAAAGFAVEVVGSGLVVRGARRGVQFERRHGAVLVLQLPLLAPELAECVRMLAGLLRVGVETEAATLALEADLDDHISTTKGCYTGQEIVARIHTYGHTNRKACLLWLGAGRDITEAEELQDDDEIAVGRVLHAEPVPGHAARLGIGYLPKDFQALGTKLRLADGTAVEVIGYEPLA